MAAERMWTTGTEPNSFAALPGLVTTLALRADGAPGRCRRGLEAVGRTAMSCYVFQNVVASALCYGWGLGLAQRWADYRPWWVGGAWAGVCLLFVTLASRWLRRFDRGSAGAVDALGLSGAEALVGEDEPACRGGLR